MEIEKHNLMRTAMLLLLMMLTATTAWADHKIVVIADPHVMSNDLLVGNQNNEDGSAWQTYLAGSRKLIDYSKTLFDQTVATISGMTEKPELVLIVGDLTKDGEQASHNYVQTKLAALKAAGIQPLVIPGNHDLGTTEAKVYNGDATSDATTIAGADAFATQYADYGYGLTSTERESTTLTYACEPISGLVVIGIDSGTDGVLSETTLRWVCGKAIVARAAGKQVIAMMHHPLIPHITGGNMFVETVSVSNYANVRNRLDNAGITTIFTGHFHTSDIAKDWNADKTKTIYDVTTGSLCSYPCDYRVVTLNNDFTEMSIETETATSDATITAAAAKERLTNSMTTILAAKLTLAGYGELASTVAPLLANAYVFHAEGNENLSGNAQTYLNTIISILDEKLASQEINSVQYFALSALVTSMLQDKSNYGTDRVNQTNDRELIVITTPDLTIDGDGTASAPYEISSYAQLKLFAEIVNLGYTDACAILKDDIVCKSSMHDGGYDKDWTPIGNYDDKYTGTFNGQGYTIRGLSTPTDNDADYVGLFGYVGSGGVVQNVTLVDANITGKSFVGGIVGCNGGTIQNIVVDNSNISGSNSSVGSMAGCNDGTIQNCAFIGTSIVRGSNDYTGGIAGHNSGTVKNSYVALSGSGSISATGNNAGGIVGYNGSTIESCHYSGSGAISSVDNVGGVVGTNFNQGKVRYCYYAGTGEITATANSNFIGAIIGKNNGTTEYCYYNTDNTSLTKAIGIVSDTGNVKGLTAAQFKDENFLTTYNFSDQIWLQGVVAPLLKGMPYTVSFKANGGTGSMDDQTVTSENDDVLRSNSFTRDNYHFTGWNTKADGKGVAVATDVQAKLVGPETLYAQWHTLTAHPAVAATCTEAGNTAYWECETCHKYFSDASGEHEITEDSWVIPATGHRFTGDVCDYCHVVRIPYLDAGGDTQYCTDYTVLDNTMNNLAAGWYVVNSNIGYASTLTFTTGDAHLILCDGVTLTVKNINAATKLNIYAQSGNSGKMTVNANDNDTYGIYSYNEVNINGGTVSIENAKYGIYTYFYCDIKISGAKVFIDNTEHGIHTENSDSGVKIYNATVEITAAKGDMPCAFYVNDKLTINNSTVKASATSTNDGVNIAAISAGSIDISGGKSYVEATASSPDSYINCGIYANLINITDATVLASAESTAANTDKGIGIYSNGDITINSGKVTANGDYIGMSADNHNITLGYNNFGDYIYASSYSGIVNIKDGKAFTYDNGAGSATPYNVSAIDIAGKYLFPVVNEITLKANSDGANNYWATFYCGHTSFTADANTTIYKGAENGNKVQLTAVEDIPAGNAVVLKSSEPTIELTLSTTASADFTGNGLKGTDIDMVPPANTYCLTNGGNGVGFYQFSATYGNIPANRAYLIIAGGGGNGAPAYNFLGFDEEDADGISSLTPALSKGEGVIYDLQGRKVDKPTHGLYIVNGKKVIKTP